MSSDRTDAPTEGTGLTAGRLNNRSDVLTTIGRSGIVVEIDGVDLSDR